MAAGKGRPRGPRSSVFDLPDAIRDALDVRIVRSHYAQYAKHSRWLEAQGHPISEHALKRYSRHLRSVARIRMATIEASALVGSTHDEGQLADATVRLAQTRLYEVMDDSENASLADVATASRAAADLARSSRTLREERRKTIRAAASAAEAVARRKGLPDDIVSAIREALEQSAPTAR